MEFETNGDESLLSIAFGILWLAWNSGNRDSFLFPYISSFSSFDFFSSLKNKAGIGVGGYLVSKMAARYLQFLFIQGHFKNGDLRTDGSAAFLFFY